MRRTSSTAWRLQARAAKRAFSENRRSGERQPAAATPGEVDEHPHPHPPPHAARAEDRDFFLSILHANSTKREARSYIQRFTPPSPALALASPAPSSSHPPSSPSSSSATTPTVPTGGTAAAATAPKTRAHPPSVRPPAFTPDSLRARNQNYVARLLENHLPGPQLPHTRPEIEDEDLHLALVKIRDVGSLGEWTLRGVTRTLRQLKRLGLLTIVVVDEGGGDGTDGMEGMDASGVRERAERAVDRVVAALEANRCAARRVDGAVSLLPAASPTSPASSTPSSASDAAEPARPEAEVSLPSLLLAPLSRGVIPVLAPTAYDPAQRLLPTRADDTIIALTRLLSSTSPPPRGATRPPVPQPVHLDRLIFLDPLGGIPSTERASGAHVFVNLAQEYAVLSSHLVGRTYPGHARHLRNLRTMRTALSLLPATSSGVVTTAEAAAARDIRGARPHPSTTSTPLSPPQDKTDRNPLIHNLLTDKPVFSSSLPTHTSPATVTTLLKAGVPLRVFPSGTRLTDAVVDLPKLVALIEASFGKRLDVRHYLDRVDENVACLVVAGDYEGAAIVTWERPPPPPSPPPRVGVGVGEDATNAAAGEPIAYLDKFAVLPSSQGVGGVADVVFKAMVDALRHTSGIVWRSRKSNPVNKWYFERAKGAWKLPRRKGEEVEWTMFWTSDVDVGLRRLAEYEAVCRGVEPSLVDRKTGGRGEG